MPGSNTEQPRRPRRKKPDYRPWHPEAYEVADAAAVAAMANGTATEDQQRRGMAWIINNLCRTYDMTFIPDSTRDTDFAEGKRHVGLQLVKMIKLNTGKLAEKDIE